MITDYPSLQTAIADWLARADLTAQIPTFIQLAEQRFARELRVRQMQASDSGSISGGVIVLPDDCREVQSVRVAVGGREVELPPLPPWRLQDHVANATPIGYVTVNNNLKVIGGQDGMAYTLTYWQELPDLASAPMKRNWLIQREPGLYLYAALLEAAPYIQDTVMVQAWMGQYRDIMENMKIEDDRARYGNSPAIAVRMP